MKINDNFSPTIASLGQPGRDNALSILGAGILSHDKQKKENELRDIKLQDIQDQRADEKQLADFASSGKSLRQWQEEGNGFKTSKGVLAANALLKQRAAERLQKEKFGFEKQKFDANVAQKNRMFDETRRKNDYTMGFPVAKSDIMDRIAGFESKNSYTAKNPNSSAYGKYQFLDSTYKSAADALGMDDATVRSPEGQEKAMQWLTDQNKTILEKSNIPVNDFTLYGMHQQGAGGFKRIMAGNPTVKDLENMVNNTPKKYRTGNPREDWLNFYQKKFAPVETRQKPDPVKAKQQAVIATALTKAVMGLGDGTAKAEALGVLNDPTMSTANKVKAVSAYESAYPNATVKGGSKAERYMSQIEMLEGKSALSAVEKRRLDSYKRLLAKEEATAMSDLSKKERDVNTITQRLRDTLPPELKDVSLSEIDTRTLTPEQKAMASRTGAWQIKGMGLKNSAFDKDIAAMVAQNKQAENALDYTMSQLAKGKEFNALNRKKRDILSNYMGLSEDDMAVAFRDKQAQALFNKYRHGLFGGTLSKTEAPEFEKEASTLYRANSDIGLAISSMLETNLAKFEGIRSVLTPEAFNLKYGDIYRNLSEMLDVNKKALGLNGESEKQKKKLVFQDPSKYLNEEQNNEGDKIDNSTEETVHPVNRETMPDGRIKVTFSNGEVKYARKKN